MNVTVTAAAGRLPGRVGPAKRACAAITMPVPPSRCQCRHHDASAAIMMPVGNFIPAQTPTAAAAAAAAGQVEAGAVSSRPAVVSPSRLSESTSQSFFRVAIRATGTRLGTAAAPFGTVPPPPPHPRRRLRATRLAPHRSLAVLPSRRRRRPPPARARNEPASAAGPGGDKSRRPLLPSPARARHVAANPAKETRITPPSQKCK